jgi:hypothetical protein
MPERAVVARNWIPSRLRGGRAKSAVGDPSLKIRLVHWKSLRRPSAPRTSFLLLTRVLGDVDAISRRRSSDSTKNTHNTPNAEAMRRALGSSPRSGGVAERGEPEGDRFLADPERPRELRNDLFDVDIWERVHALPHERLRHEQGRGELIRFDLEWVGAPPMTARSAC